MANFRRSQRYSFHLDLLLKGTYRNTPTTTEDVSFHGVFIRTDEERTPNQLLKFIVVDPRNGEHVELLGIVARCVTRAEANAVHPPGVGVSLFGNDRATEARWVAIMRQIKMWVELGHRVAPPIRASVAADAAAAAALGAGQSTLVGQPRPLAAAPTPMPGTPAPRSVPPPAAPPASPTSSAPGAPPPARTFGAGQPVTGSGIVRPLVPPPPDTPPPRDTLPPPAGQPPRRETPMMASGVSPPFPGSPPIGENTPPPLPHGIDATKRAHERRPAKFNVTLRPEGIAALQQFEIKDISEGGTFVLTQTLVPLGSRVNLRLVHPQTGDTFQITGHVARAVDSLDASEKGIGIKFDGDALDRRGWSEFVGRLAPLRRELPPNIPPPPEPGVRVLRGRPDPPILLGTDEAPMTDAAMNDAPGGDPGLPPVILDGQERPVPVLLGAGLTPPRKPF